MRDVNRSAHEENTPGHYANCFQVGHNAFEFVLDFGQVSPETRRPEFHLRIIVAPASAKRFAELLQHALQDFQHGFGRSQPIGLESPSSGLSQPE